MTRIIITGSKGRMGQALINCAAKIPDLQVAAQIDQGDDLGAVIDKCDVVIDFSFHSSTAQFAELCAAHKKALVVGTTGHSDDERSKIKNQKSKIPLFACHQENVQPDFLALAKGLTGGYLPMAATLTTQNVFDAFLGEYEDFKTFFHGHSYTGNQLGASAALASLEILQSKKSISARHDLEKSLRRELNTLWALPNVGDIRQVGLVAGIELVRDWRTREPFDPRESAGIRVCEAMGKEVS
jgi:hypothetical protein